MTLVTSTQKPYMIFWILLIGSVIGLLVRIEKNTRKDGKRDSANFGNGPVPWNDNPFRKDRATPARGRERKESLEGLQAIGGTKGNKFHGWIGNQQQDSKGGLGNGIIGPSANLDH